MKLVSLAGLLFSLLLLPGCTGTDVLSSGNFAFTFELSAIDEGTTDYGCVLLEFINFVVTPLDAEASEFLAPDGLNLANGISEVSFKPSTCTSAAAVELPPLVLGSGEYVVSKLRMVNFKLEEEAGGATDVDCTTPIDPIAENILLEPLIIKVGDDQPNKLTIELNVTAMDTALRTTDFPGICNLVVDNFNDIFQFR